jgi:dTDP-4-amino-4,6-dideoxygalactose transaminase
MTQSQLALLGGTRIYPSDWFGSKWPLATGKEQQEIQDVLDSYIWKGGSIGPKVKKFSNVWAKYCQAKYCIPVTNGTTALVLSLQALDVQHGDEIILPAWSCAAVVDAVHRIGALPVFTDIQSDNLGLDPRSVAKAISPRTRAIIVVHFGGHPADLDGLKKISDHHRIPLLEDAASSHGVTWRNRKVGSIGDCGIFSFGQGKNLTCGQGGAIITNAPDIYEMVHSLSEFGQVPGTDDSFERHFRVGINERMSEFHAAILLAQFSKLDEWNEARAKSAYRLAGLLEEIPGITPVRPDPRVTQHTWNLLLFRMDSDTFSGISKELFCRAVTAEGIFIAPMHTRPLYEEPMYDLERLIVKGTAQPIRVTPCPETERACQEVSGIHHSMLMIDSSLVDPIAEAIAKVQRFSGELATSESSVERENWREKK